MAKSLLKCWRIDLQLAWTAQEQLQKQPTNGALGLPHSLSAEDVGQTNNILAKGWMQDLQLTPCVSKRNPSLETLAAKFSATSQDPMWLVTFPSPMMSTLEMPSKIL